MTLDLLFTTLVGKVVNRLRNHIEHGNNARTLVAKWRQLLKDLPEDIEISKVFDMKKYGQDALEPEKTSEKRVEEVECNSKKVENMETQRQASKTIVNNIADAFSKISKETKPSKSKVMPLMAKSLKMSKCIQRKK